MFSHKHIPKNSTKKFTVTSKIIIFILIGVIVWLFLVMIKFSPEILNSNESIAIENQKRKPAPQQNLRDKSGIEFKATSIASSTLSSNELSVRMFSTAASTLTPRTLRPTSISTFSSDDAVLIVGGTGTIKMLHRILILLAFTILTFITDGSGTRRVVQTLIQLGVKMVSEDAETFDIHADLGKL